MKLKGINQFEQHVEKLLLGAAVVIAGGIVAWQFISAPTAKVGGQTVTPGEVDGRLRARASALEAKLRDDSVSLEGLSTDAVAPEFEKALRGSVSPTKRLAATSPNFNGRLVKSSAGGSGEAWYFVPKIPVVQMRGVLESVDALTAESAKAAKAASSIVAARPDFAEIDGPRDIVWTTPYARIDLKALRAALAESDPASSPPKAAVPSVWYQETPYVVDVVFERRELAADGSWGAPVTVPVFAERPEELGFRSRIENPPIELRDEVFALLGSEANQREILQPAFYDTVNDAFVSPAFESQSAAAVESGVVGEEARAQRRKLQLQTEVQSKQRRAEALMADINKLGGLWDDELEKKREKEEKDRKKDEERGSGGGGGAPGGGGGGLGGAMGGKNNQDEANAARDEKKRQQDRKTKSAQYRRLMADIAAMEKELGVEPSAKAAGAPKAPSLASMDELLVWGHDMEVQPGRTYQYRCVTRVYNPFFGKGNQLVREQDASGITSRFTLDSVASEWSADFSVSPKVQFFVKSSSLGDGVAGSGSAQVEVYVLQGGRWRQDEVSVSPGERIGRIDDVGGEKVDFTTDYFLLDVVEDLDPKRATGAARKLGVAIVAPVGGGTPEIRAPAAEMNSPVRLKKRMQAEFAESAPAPEAPKQGAGPSGG